MTEPWEVLLADDDEDDRFFFNEALGRVPITTNLTFFSDGEELLHYLGTAGERLPDVLFLDLQMPKADGFECLKAIKGDPKLQTLPVIICSNSEDVRSVDRAFKEGADLYLVKPPELIPFIHIIHKTLFLISEKDFVQPSQEKFVVNRIALR